MTNSIELLGSGVVTPVGLGSAQTATSIRAGVSRIREITEADWAAPDGSPYRGGFLAGDHLEELHRKTRGVDADSLAARTIRLGGAALRQLAPLLARTGVVPPLVLGIGDEAQLPDASAQALIDNLMRQSRVRLRVEASEVLPPGRAAGLLAVHRAMQRLEAGEPGPILAGGIDSYFDPRRLDDLDADGRLLNDANPDGFLPGEGAAFVVLARGRAHATESQPLARLVSPAVGFERGHLRSSEPLLGDGLAETVAATLGAVLPARLPCTAVYMNLTGEHLGAKEWGVAYLRNKRFFAEDVHLVHPAECTGEAGAATGPLLVALAATDLARRAGLALVWCAADEAERAALCVVPADTGAVTASSAQPVGTRGLA